MGLAGFARPLEWFKSQWLWLLLSIAAFWLLMRVQVEWLWFGQFDWQGMLLRRWLWQLGGLLLALLVVATCQLWQRNWIKLEGASKTTVLQGDQLGVQKLREEVWLLVQPSHSALVAQIVE